MSISLYIAGYQGTGSPLDPRRPKYSDGASRVGNIRSSRDMTLTMAKSPDPMFHAQLAGDISGDPEAFLLCTVPGEKWLGQSAQPVLNGLGTFLESQGLPNKLIADSGNASYLTYRQTAWYVAAMSLMPQRFERLTRKSWKHALRTRGRGGNDTAKMNSIYDKEWKDLPSSLKSEFVGAWEDHRRWNREDFNRKFAGRTFGESMLDLAEHYERIHIGGLDLSVPQAAGFVRLFDYSENRTSVATDTFTTNIPSTWDNPPSNGTAMAWNSASPPFVNPGTLSVVNIMRWNDDVFDDDQYSIITINNCEGNSIVYAFCRIAADSVGFNNCYAAIMNTFGTDTARIQYSDDGAMTDLTSDTANGQTLNADDTVTLEVEGDLLRYGLDSGAGDAEIAALQTTDDTYASGQPGLGGFRTSVNQDTDIRGWEGGEISGGAATITGSGTPAAQDISMAGTGVLGFVGSGTPASQAASSSGAGSRAIPGSGAPSAQDSDTSGAGSMDRKGTGTPASQSADASGSGFRTVAGSGTPSSQVSTASGAGLRSLDGTGAVAAASASVSGTGVLQIKLLLTQAEGTELRDEAEELVADLSNIAYEWYDGTGSTAGNPVQTGTFSTDANGEAIIQLPNSSLTSGQTGTLILYHPSSGDVIGIYALVVT